MATWSPSSKRYKIPTKHDDSEEVRSHPQARLTCWYDIAHREVRQDFHDYHLHKKGTTTAFLALQVIVIIGVLWPLAIMNTIQDLQFPRSSPYYAFRLFLSFSGIASMSIGSLSGMMILCHRYVTKYAWLRSLKLQDMKLKLKLHVVYILVVQWYFILVYLRRVFSLNCLEEPSRMVLMFGGGKCFEDHIDREQSAMTNAMTMFLLPVLVVTCIPEVPIVFIWFNLMLAVVAYLGSLIEFQLIASIPLVSVWAIMSFFVIRDVQLRNITIFFTQRRLKEALLENEKMQEANHANEMRSMIGNVAHDLKTVSRSSLM